MPPDQSDLLINALHALSAQGPEKSFEELIRTLLERWASATFILAGTGKPQHGSDMLSADPNAASIHIECKKYLQRTRLDDRELAGEVAQSIDRYGVVDLWGLVATKDVGADEVWAAERLADQLRAEFLLLDERADGRGLLQVLCARYPDTTIPFLAKHAPGTIDLSQVERRLTDIRAIPGYEERVIALTRTLSGKLLGFPGAKRRMADWLRTHVEDRKDSMAAFNQDMALLRPGRRVFKRSHINDRLTTWWDSAGEPPHMAILGEEGTGKTWAAMGWLLELLERPDAPLILPLTSNLRPCGNIVETVADVLHHRLSHLQKGLDWWRRKVWQWWGHLPEDSGILFLMDGLNEQPDAEWCQILAGASTRDSAGRVSLLITCRPAFWNDTLKSTANSVATLPTDGYEEDELPDVLDHARPGLTLAQIPTDLHALIRRPRFCNLVARHFDDPHHSPDLMMTIEWLLFMDYKTRWEATKTPGSRQGFEELLGSLAQRHLAEWRRGDISPSVGRRDLDEMVPYSDEKSRILADIVTGGLTVPSGNRTRPFQIDPQRLAYGMGMLLADEIKHHPGTVDDCTHRIGSWLEPQPDMDAKTIALGAALLFSLPHETPDYPAIPRQALLRQWIGARNQDENVQAAMARHLLDCPTDVLTQADNFWRAAHGNEAVQRAFDQAILRHRDHPNVKPALIAATSRWMGYVQGLGVSSKRRLAADPLPDMPTPPPPAAVIAERLGAEAVPGTIMPFHGYDLPITDDDGHLRLARFAIRIISAGERQPFIDSIIAWALSHRVMDEASEHREVEWLLRWTDEDMWAIIGPIASSLANSGDETAAKAAYLLAGCVGTAEALSWRDGTLDHLYPPNEFHLAHQRDPCRSLVAWSRELCEPCLEREDVALWRRLQGVERHCIDPSVVAPAAFIAVLRQAAQEFVLDQVHGSMSRSAEDRTFDQYVAAMARLAPEALGELTRRLVRTLPERTGEAAHFLAVNLDHKPLAARDAEVRALRTALAASAAQAPDWPTPDPGVFEDNRAKESCTLAALASCISADDLVDTLIDRPLGAFDSRDLDFWLEGEVSTETAAALCERLLHEDQPVRQARILWCLSHGEPPFGDPHRQRILEILDHGQGWAHVAAMRLIVATRNPTLVEAVMSSDRAFLKPFRELFDYHGWRLLLSAGTGLSLDSLLGRLSFPCVSFALSLPGRREEEIDAYAGLLDLTLRRVSGVNPTAFDLGPIRVDGAGYVRPIPSNKMIYVGDGNPNSWLATQGMDPRLAFSDMANPEDRIERHREFLRRVEVIRAQDGSEFMLEQFDDVTLATIARRQPDLAERWVDEIIDHPKLRRTAAGFAQSLCAALVEARPDLGFRLWRHLFAANEVQFTDPETALDWMTGLPFSVSESPESLGARGHMLSVAQSDAQLADIAVAALAHGHGEWLLTQIQALVSAAPLWRKAKGMTLAALADLEEATFAALAAQADVAGSWVHEQMPDIRALHDHNVWSRHWYRQFLTAPDTDTAYAGFVLFLRSVDGRARVWVPKLEDEGCVDPRRLRYRRAQHSAIAGAIKENAKGRDEKFLTLEFNEGEVLPIGDGEGFRCV